MMPLLTILVVDAQRQGVPSQVEHQVLALHMVERRPCTVARRPCITRLLLLGKDGRSQAASVHQGCRRQGMQQSSRPCCRQGHAELLCKVRLSTSSWHLAYGVARQKSNMDAPTCCHSDHLKVLHHLTCCTCCCCGSSADEVKGHMQGHRGRGCSRVTNENAVRCRGCGLL